MREWEPISTHKDFFENAASTVGNTPAGFGALLSLLISVGRVFLPEALLWLSEAIKEDQGQALLSDLNAQFELEVLLRNLSYTFGTSVRRNPIIHRVVISFLDRLVERGSHSAFRLRDYVVGPLPTSD